MTAQRFLLRTLGTFELHALDERGRPGERILGPGKPLALLAFCTSAREREHSRDALAALLWGDADPTRARQSLRQALWRLRRSVGDLVRVRDDAVVGVDHAIASDRERVLDALHRGDTREALDAYGGPFLPGVSLPGGDEFDDWASLERRHLEDQLVRASEPFLHGVLRAGKPALARSLAERLVTVAPDSAEAHRIAAETSLGAGDTTSARRAVDRLEALLLADGARISATVSALIARAREREPSLGEVRATSVSLDLVGRESAFATALDAWLRARRGESGIVVIGGVAGIGKSRLLAAIAERCDSRKSLSVFVRANAGERELPFGFAAALARALAALPGAAGVGAESARELVALDPGLGSVFHAAPSQLDGGEAVRRRALALLDLLTAIAEQEPLALFLDDLHWVDAASRQLLSIVLGRAADLPLLVVGTSRGTLAGLFDDRTTQLIGLGPLARSDVIDAIRSSGSWPDSPEAAEFIAAVADSCDGIPLQVVERLALAEERGLLVRGDGAWTSPDWRAAIVAVTVGSPIDQRLRECSAEERAAMLVLATAGAPIEERVLDVALRNESSGNDSAASVQERMSSLEAKGLAVRMGRRWTSSHDLLAEQSIAIASSDEREAAHRRIGRALAESGHPDAAAAVRHLLLGRDDARAGATFSGVMRRARAAGDRRHPRDLLAAMTGESLPEERRDRVWRSVPLRERVSWPHPAVTAGVALLLATASTAMAWSTLRKPELMFVQEPLALEPTPLVGADAYQLMPAAVVSSRDGAISRIGAVHVRALSPGVEFITPDSAQLRQGRAAFGGLRLRGPGRTATLRFEAPGFSPLDVVVGRPDRSDTTVTEIVRAAARIMSGQVNGARIHGPVPHLQVAAGTRISGVIQLEYDAPWSRASVWLSMTPTWGEASSVGRDLEPVPTPVRQQTLDVRVDVDAPAQAGHGWILFMIDAEPSGGFALSGTNWTVERPLWGDDNDLRSLPDDTVRMAAANGRLNWWRAFPAARAAAPCKEPVVLEGIAVRYCQREFALAAIEVTVK